MTTLIGIISFLAVAYGVVTFLLPRFGGPSLPKGVLVLTLGLIGISTSYLVDQFIRIDGQHVGVVQGIGGINKDELQPGLRFIMPWERVELMDITEQVYSFSNSKHEGDKPYSDAIWASTRDLNIGVNKDSTNKIGMKVGIDVSVSWRIIPTEASWIYQNIAESDVDPNTNTRYIWISENIIRNKTQSVVSDIVKNYTPEQCIMLREEIQRKVFDKLNGEVKDRRICVFQVNIRGIFYDKTYEDKINAKKLNELEALNQKEVTKQLAEKEAQAVKMKNIKITEAQGQAEALRIQGEALAENPAVKDLEWIKAWKDGGSQVPNTLIIGQGQNSSFLMNLDGNKVQKSKKKEKKKDEKEESKDQ